MIRALPLVLILAGCASGPRPAGDAPVHGGVAQACEADGLGDLVGKAATQALGADALARSGARTLRWIAPGTMVTMDFRRDRLDIHLDATNLVTSINCG